MDYGLVNSYQDVLGNAQVFNYDLINSSDMTCKISVFPRYYYFAEFDGFVPSKFIGYKDNTMKKYWIGNCSGMDGRVTALLLKKWFIEIDDFEFERYF